MLFRSFDKSTAAKIGKLAGASHLFVGSFTVVGDKMRLDGRMLAVATGEVTIAEQISGEKAYFFELEQKLVEKVVALLGVHPAPKEKAAMARPHTADFQAFKQFSDGIKAFDDGRLDEAMKHLNEATAIDKDFKLASLTLEEYERLSAQVRAKAEAAGHVEDEVARLEKNQAIAGEVSVVRKLWPVVDSKGTSADAKLLRVAAACALANAYRDAFGFRRRGPVNSEDLARAGFDDFMLERTADALFARAWAEAPDVFPRVPPLCIGFGVVSAGRPEPIEKLLGYEIERAQKLTTDTETLLSYMANNAQVDPAAAWLHLDPVGEVKLWEKLYALAQKLPKLKDEDRARYEETIAERRRAAGDLDGSTQMYAAASRHTKASHKLKEYAAEIDKNKQAKVALDGAGAGARELFLLDHREPGKADAKRLAHALDSARELREGFGRAAAGEFLLVDDLPLWRVTGRTMGLHVGTGPRTSRRRTSELRYELDARSSSSKAPDPVVLASSLRGKRLTARVEVGASRPADWRPDARNPGAEVGEAGVAFALTRTTPEGGIDKRQPTITIGYAVLVGADRVRLVQLTRDGEHNLAVTQLAEQGLGGGRGARALEVAVEPGKVTATVDGKRVAFPWKPAGEPDGFIGLAFFGAGYAQLTHPSIAVK